MSNELTRIIKEQTVMLFHNVKTAIITCDMNAVLCGLPVWKHIYHALHSCDKWFINPACYEEPPFHESGLDSLNVISEAAFSREMLMDYYGQVRQKTLDYLDGLNDNLLTLKPNGCPYTRMALILGQYRHLYAHLGNINATIIINTGRWPRVAGLDADLSDDLYE